MRRLLRHVYEEYCSVRDAEQRALQTLNAFDFPTYKVDTGQVSLTPHGNVEFMQTGRATTRFPIGEARSMALWILAHTDEED